MNGKLLIIEDETSLAKQLKWGLSDTYEIITANTADKARQLLASGAFPVATLDLGLPPSPDTPTEGFRLLEDLPGLAPHTKVIVITGNAEQENAMKAVDLGAADFCSKPIDLDLLKIILKRTFHISELEAANRRLKEEQGNTYSLCGMIGISPAMNELFKLIQQVSRTEYPVLVRGESGTGKEMVARALHSLSNRKKKPLVVINCGAIPDTLLESELFGHEKGAFTGATGRQIGKFEQADQGTVFLDEIGDMPMELQVKLLRFLQEGTIDRVGGSKTLHLDVRVIAATHVDLEQSIGDGKFREDLFYRLNVVPMVIPPLRDRREDILFLTNHFIKEESQKLKRGRITLSHTASAALSSHSWPGNVRELQNSIYRALAMADDNTLHPSDLGLPDPQEIPDEQTLPTIKAAREAGERQAVLRALAMTDNNISHAAKLLEVSRPTLHDLLKKHGIERE